MSEAAMTDKEFDLHYNGYYHIKASKRGHIGAASEVDTINTFNCKESALYEATVAGGRVAFLHTRPKEVGAKLNEYFHLLGRKEVIFALGKINKTYEYAIYNEKGLSKLEKEVAYLIFRAFQKKPNLIDEPADLTKITFQNYFSNNQHKEIFHNLRKIKPLLQNGELAASLGNGFNTWVNGGGFTNALERLKNK